ncbi:hypothetical protein [Bacillus thermotolerans]|uniref:hypothetical protein n=1 Tax=Bacillus thermotolerans TaxID=1221996 RepID=UPI0005893FF6|nr:hypothetical protein [Bacillus thermotolerans]KKB44104.1 hypothetical protein QY96_03730 [Bacillus thermotolerans]
MFRKRQRAGSVTRVLLLAVIGAAVGWLGWKVIVPSPGEEAWATVNEFYQYEQEGNFSESWELFHPFMKEKFDKGHYLQDRAHVFMNHFGVETFEYSLDDPVELEIWKPAEDGPEFKIVYRVTVVQQYKGKYGNFSIEQDVFVVEEKDEWLVMWNYNEQ